MKRYIVLILVIGCLLVLTSCSAHIDKPTPTPIPTAAPTIAPTPEPTPEPIPESTPKPTSESAISPEQTPSPTPVNEFEGLYGSRNNNIVDVGVRLYYKFPVNNILFIANTDGTFENSDIVRGDKFIYEKDNYIYRIEDNIMRKIDTRYENKDEVIFEHDKKLSCLGVDENYIYFLCCVSESNRVDYLLKRISLEDDTVESLAEIRAYDIMLSNGWIYYTNYNTKSINKISTDGKTKKQILKGEHYHYLCVQDDWVYFSVDPDWNEDQNDCYISRVKTDGSNFERILDLKGRHLNATEGYLFFSNIEDSSKLYRYDINSGEVIKIDDNPYVQCIDIINGRIIICYSSKETSSVNGATSMFLDGTSKVLLYSK